MSKADLTPEETEEEEGENWSVLADTKNRQTVAHFFLEAIWKKRHLHLPPCPSFPAHF